MKPLQVSIGIIRNPKTDHMLFQVREKDPYKGHFGLIGGKLNPVENSENALVREIKEETSLDVAKYEYIGAVHETLLKDDSQIKVTLHLYQAEVRGTLVAKADEGKVHWVDIEHFYGQRESYIPTDWLIVKTFLDNEALFREILVEMRGEKYEIRSIN